MAATGVIRFGLLLLLWVAMAGTDPLGLPAGAAAAALGSWASLRLLPPLTARPRPAALARLLLRFPWQALPERMGELVTFIHEESEINDLLKAALIHFYMAYLHPYFDGNGRMARLMHLWYLVQQGYSSALFVPLSEYINKSRKGYYDAYTLVEENATISGMLDATPFLAYFIENVYHKLNGVLPTAQTTEAFQTALSHGQVTEKEKALWEFVLSAYGDAEFSTKQLEKDFGNAAYATIRSFVLKFEKLGLLKSTQYGNRVKYAVRVC